MASTYIDELDTSELDDEEIDNLVEDLIADQNGNLPPELAKNIADKLMDRAGEYTNTGPTHRVFSTLDGSPSDIPEYMLSKILKFRRVDDPRKRRFSMKQLIPWKPGDFKCELHPEHPMFGEYMRLGFSLPCTKKTLKSELEVRRHMEKKHKDEWRTRTEAERTAKEEQDRVQAAEDRAFQRMLMERLVNMQAGSLIRDLPSIQEVLPNEPGPLDETECTCDWCGWVAPKTSKNPVASVNTHKRFHCPNKE